MSNIAKNFLQLLLALTVSSAVAFGLVRGGFGLQAEYDSNVFGDYWGGGSLNATAYLDLGLDAGLGIWGLAIGADYNGDFSTYLQYRDMEQSDHDLRMLVWGSAGENGYLALGGGIELGVNGLGRIFYDNRYFYGMAEGKVYLLPSFLVRFTGQMGPLTYLRLPKYDCDRFSGEISTSLFLPSRTSISACGLARRFVYRPGADSLQVPKSIYHIEPGIRLTQNLAKNLGLSVEYFGLINKVSTASVLYSPDTLLIWVADYSDYRGGASRAKLTARIGAATVVAKVGYRFLNYSKLEAYALPQSDTSSLAARQPTGTLRQDRISSLGLEVHLPLSRPVGAKAGLEFINHGSNDPLFNYYRTIVSFRLEYAF